MAEYCSACNKLKELNPEFILNGITTSIYNSLKNNTGLKPSLGHNNCEDLNDMVDCLIGSLQDKINAYDVCDWREFMDSYLANQRNIDEAIIASDCGQWEKIIYILAEISKIWKDIANIWTNINSIWNTINNMQKEIDEIKGVLQDEYAKTQTYRYTGTGNWAGTILTIQKTTMVGKPDIYNAVMRVHSMINVQKGQVLPITLNRYPTDDRIDVAQTSVPVVFWQGITEPSSQVNGWIQLRNVSDVQGRFRCYLEGSGSYAGEFESAGTMSW